MHRDTCHGIRAQEVETDSKRLEHTRDNSDKDNSTKLFTGGDMITEENAHKFKELYEKAVSNSDETFVFEGQYVLTAYAKYMIKYLTLSKMCA